MKYSLLICTALVAGFVMSPGLSTTAGGQSLFGELKARQAGDLVIVILAEQTAAQSESSWNNRSSSASGGSAGINGGAGLSGRFGADAQFQIDNRSRNQAVQRDLLNGTITAIITDVQETGNFVIAGERSLTVNGETHVLKVNGLIRPTDIRFDNSLLSYQIANAEIEYRQSGRVNRMFKPGFFARAGVAALLGGAVYVALTN